MRRLILMSIVFSLFICAGCKKDNKSTANNKVKTYSITQNGRTDTQTYMYDSDGKLKSITYAPQPIEKQIYTYTKDSLVIDCYLNDSAFPYSILVYPLNSNGQVASTANGHTYTYDTERHLLSDITNNNGVHYTWQNGNLITLTTINSIGSTVINMIYSNVPDLRDYGTDVFGKNCKNVEAFRIHGRWDTTHITTQLDAAGRVSTVTWVENQQVDTYTYY